jgi:hypothetical protein
MDPITILAALAPLVVDLGKGLIQKFTVSVNTTFANNANLKKPFLQGGVTRITT